MCYKKWNGKELVILNNVLKYTFTSDAITVCVKLYSHMIEHSVQINLNLTQILASIQYKYLKYN